MKLVDWSLAIYEGLHHQFFFWGGEGETMALMGNIMVSEGVFNIREMGLPGYWKPFNPILGKSSNQLV